MKIYLMKNGQIKKVAAGLIEFLNVIWKKSFNKVCPESYANFTSKKSAQNSQRSTVVEGPFFYTFGTNQPSKVRFFKNA